MRFSRTGTIVISEDDSTSPQDLRFQDAQRQTIESAASTPATTIVSCISQGFTLPKAPTSPGVPTVYELFPPADLTTGKYFYLRSDDNPFHLQINNQTALIVPGGGHVCEMWCDFTSLKVSNVDPANSVRLTWAIAGQ